MAIGQELLNVRFSEMVKKLALAIAESQTELDKNSTDMATYMASQDIELPDRANPSETKKFPLLAMGFLPTFYAVQEAEIEVKMSISMSRETEASTSASVKGGWGPVAAQVNASYSARYGYKQEGASRLVVKLAPADPPVMLQKYMEAVMTAMAKEHDALFPPAPDPGAANQGED
ncbi:MAG: hypothetical protein AAGF88_09670 [Pseudomonadota bacterium]